GSRAGRPGTWPHARRPTDSRPSSPRSRRPPGWSRPCRACTGTSRRCAASPRTAPPTSSCSTTPSSTRWCRSAGSTCCAAPMRTAPTPCPPGPSRSSASAEAGEGGARARLHLAHGGKTLYPSGPPPMTALLRPTPDGFLRAGEKHLVISGALHYFRVHPGQWRDRLRRLVAMGCNTVETYVAWNVHQPARGATTFEGFADLGRFLDIAAE